MDSRSPATPSSPYTLATDRYKTNVNRTKTRKWVEAKKVDYGGDDWGADDDFEEDDADNSASAPADRYQTQPQPQPPALRPGRLTAGLRAVGEGSSPSTPRSGSAGSARSMRPSERIAMERQTSGGQQRSVTGPPALSIHTGVQQQRPVQPAEPQSSQLTAQSQFPPRKSSMTNQERPDLTINPAGHPPRASSRPQSPAVESGVRSPPSAGGSSAQPKVIRPSEIYKRMEEEKDKERRSMDSVRRSSLESAGSRTASGPGGDVDSLEGGVKSATRPSGDGSRSLQPLATVDERKSEYGFDGLVVNPDAALTSEGKESSHPAPETARETKSSEPSMFSQSKLPTLQHPQPASEPEPRKRFSTSPKLPDLTRMSGFGSDFFSSGGGFMSESPKQPEALAEATPKPVPGPGSAGGTPPAEQTVHEAEQKTATPTPDQPAQRYITQQIPEPSQPKPFRPAIPGRWVSETPSTPGEMATPGTEQARYGLGINVGDIPSISEHSEDLSLKPAPLRTPTPRDRSPKKLDEDRGSTQPSPHVPHPLRTTPSRLSQEPTKADEDGAKSPEKGAEGQAADNATAAPAPLQPARGSAADLSPEELRPAITRVDTVSTMENASPLKESDYLRDEIIRSLSPVRKSTSNLDALPDGNLARESAYLSDVYGDYWQADEPNAQKSEEKDDGELQPLSAVKEEAGSASATPTRPGLNQTTNVISSHNDRSALPSRESEPAEPSIKRERFSWEAAEKDASAAPSPTKHPLPEPPKDEGSPVDSGRHSPLLTLPVLNFGRDDVAAIPKEESPSRVVSSVSAFPPGQDATTIDPPSPASPTGGNEGPSYAVDRGSMLFSPSDDKMLTLQSPGSPGSPHPLHATADSPAATPTDIPLPRSPSPTPNEGLNPAYPQVMNLKQIMALPTSPERVYKMLEARAEFSALPSGLDQWLASALAQPEHANAGPSFKYAPAGDDLPLFAKTQQRYNRRTSMIAGGIGGGDGAGGEGAGGGAGGIGRQHSSSGGGSVRIAGASAQMAGVKGKELLQSAGKMGLGLLSKGKSKLRERAESKKG